MKFFRVSQEPLRSIGESIWETGTIPIYAELRKATQTFIGALKDNDQEYINSVFKENIKYKFTGSFLEAVWEFVRERDFPTLPARYDNMMVFKYVDTAKNFNEKYRKGEAIIYEVEINDPRYFIADMKVLDRVVNYDIADLEKIAAEYWSGKKTDNPMWEYILYPNQTVTISNIVAK